MTTWSDHSSTSRLPRLFDLVLVLMLWISLRARFLYTWSSTFPFRQWSLTAWRMFFFEECNTFLTTSHRKKKARIPSIRKPASREKSDSVELWDTDVSFLHIQLTGTKCSTSKKKHEILPDVDFESSKYPAKSESWKKPNRQCWAVLPTWQHGMWSVVWWM